MPKYKVMIKNPLEIGRFKSENGVLNAVKPNANETKRIENAISNGVLKEIPAATKTATDL